VEIGHNIPRFGSEVVNVAIIALSDVARSRGCEFFELACNKFRHYSWIKSDGKSIRKNRFYDNRELFLFATMLASTYAQIFEIGRL